MMKNPYQSLSDTAFWRRSVAALPAEAIDPVVDIPFRIFPRDRIATAGSCFAQHLARELEASGYGLMVEEGDPADADDRAAFRAFSAAYGNIYTTRQLLQLFERAFWQFEPQDIAWRRADGRYVDPFRPTICKAGFESPEAVAAERGPHLSAVRRVFELCDIFIFTLGLTECWIADSDGAIFPVAPGVEAIPPSDAYHFHTLTVEEVVSDMRQFLSLLREVNAGAQVLLTVSPVPLMATYAPQHVLVATTASKSVLRVAAGMLATTEPGVAYFPSYEIITGPQTRGRYFEPDLRSVTAEGVAQVMRIFSRHFLATGDEERHRHRAQGPDDAAVADALDRMQKLGAIICDEELIDREPVLP